MSEWSGGGCDVGVERVRVEDGAFFSSSWLGFCIEI